MSEVDPNQAMHDALNTLCARFAASSLSSSAELSKAGLKSYECHSRFDGWDGTGDFYGHLFIYFSDEEDHTFFWTIGVLFEQGKHEEIKWEQGAVYSYVSISPYSESNEQVYYQVGDAELPCKPLKISDLTRLADSIKALYDTCYADLKFVFEINGFSKLIELAQGKQKEKEAKHLDAKLKGYIVTAVHDIYELNGWKSNPLRSNQNA